MKNPKIDDFDHFLTIFGGILGVFGGFWMACYMYHMSRLPL
jgi:hypothetical protein